MPVNNITKQAIAAAMKTLMAQKPLAKISVGNIVEECGINRNSFYYHFRDKYDLINWIFYTEITQDVQTKNAMHASHHEIVAYILGYLYENKSFYQNALSATGQDSFAEYFLELLKDVVKVRAGNMFEDDEDQEFFAMFFAEAFAAVTLRWLAGGATIPPEKMTELIMRAATGGAMRLLDGNNTEN